MKDRRLARALLALLLGTASGALHAQAWEFLGPGPSHGGQVEGIADLAVVGAVNAIAVHPTNADIVYVGAVNGGIWRTTNATAAAPTWTRQTDALESLSIGSIEFDPTDATRQTLVAGIARTSSLGRRGGSLPGMLRTTDGGTTWTILAPGGPLNGRGVIGVAARGAVLVAATNNGIYRSTNTGSTFSLLSGLAGSGLPVGETTELAADPTSNARLYTAVHSGTARGIYRSNDTGETWAKVSDPAVDAVIVAGSTGSQRSRIAVGAAGQVFVGIIAQNGRLAEVFRSADGASGWTALGVPTTAEQNGVLFGVHPGGQGGIHFSIAADPVDANIVYVGGDRQPYFGEGVPGSNQFFPNSIGARDYSGRLFRGNAAAAAGSRWAPLTHTDTPRTAPHADSRDMAFDAAGNLLESDDGGIYKRLAPRTSTGAWVSLNGDLAVTEYHGLSYDTVSNRVVGGSQDNGTTRQRDATRIFDAISTGDGGHPAVEDRSSTTLSTRYTSFQFLGNLQRQVVNASNVNQPPTVFPALSVLGGGPAISPQFYTPIAVNDAVAAGDTVNAQRLLIGAANGIYESTDGGATVTFISPTGVGAPVLRINAFVGAPIVYGVPGNPGYLLVGVTVNPGGSQTNELWTRTTAGGALSQLAVLPGAVNDVAVDRDQPSRVFVLTGTSVLFSTTGTAPFANITGNLVSGFSPGTLRALAFIPTSGTDALVVGTDRGVFIARAPTFDAWTRLGTGLPNAPVLELEYDVADGVLVAGFLGRGAWIQRTPLGTPPPVDAVFANGFEP